MQLLFAIVTLEEDFLIWDKLARQAHAKAIDLAGCRLYFPSISGARS